MEPIKDLVSIIIITRNRCEILGRSITSVLNQSYKEFELIIIDGNSTDDTEKVVKSFDDKRLIYIKQEENISATHSKIIGLNRCRGKYVGLNDDDDEWLPLKLEKQLNMLVSLPSEYGCVYCWEEFWDDSSGKFVKENRPVQWGNVYHNLLKGPGGVGGGGMLLFKKEAITFFLENDIDPNLGSDYQMNLLISKKYKYCFFPEVLLKTHINHQYERMSVKNSSVFSNERKIRFYNKILKQHQDEFKKAPSLKIYHLKSLAGLLAENKDKRLIPILCEIIKIKPFKLKSYKILLSSFIKYIGK